MISMKKCYKCNVDLNIANNTCPLCHNDLGKDKENNSVFPIIPTIYTKHNLLYKILAFLSIYTFCFTNDLLLG